MYINDIKYAEVMKRVITGSGGDADGCMKANS